MGICQSTKKTKKPINFTFNNKNIPNNNNNINTNTYNLNIDNFSPFFSNNNKYNNYDYINYSNNFDFNENNENIKLLQERCEKKIINYSKTKKIY